MPVVLSDSVSWRGVSWSGDIEWKPLVVDMRIGAPAKRDISTATASMLDDLAASFGITRANGEPENFLRSRALEYATNYARTWRYSPFDPNSIDNDARKMLREWGTGRLHLALPEPSVGGDPEILRRNPNLLAVYARDRMVTTRAVYLARREDILAHHRAPRPVENPVNLDGPARCAWRAPSSGTVCETRKMRCRAHSCQRPMMLSCVASTPAICTTGKVTL